VAGRPTPGARRARRLLGMFRTVTNIWGDCCAVTVVEAWAKRYDAKLARRAKKDEAAAGAAPLLDRGRLGLKLMWWSRRGPSATTPSSRDRAKKDEAAVGAAPQSDRVG
jgi:hypothetical protein